MEQYNGISDGDINISDIIDVIQTTDPDSMATIAMDSEHIQPHVEILEQPASKALRFRYECEGRSAGSIPGINSMPENKTFPSIRIMGYKGRAMVVVSCVTKDAPYRPHPHNLVGKEVCKQGVCTVEVPSGNMVVTFSNLGIQCVKKKDIEEALRVRQELRVDPFRTGFDHKRHPTNIDLNAVRLCFQVFLEGKQKGKFNKPLPPIVSDPIYDKKAMSDLVICKLSHCSAPVAGSMDMILLCEKVAKEDIQVRFFEEKDGQLIWEGYGDFQPTHVHKQTAIAFRTPSYRSQQVEQPVQVYIQLRRPSDGATSEPPLPFQMLPLGTGRPAFWSLRKAFAKKKADYSTVSKILSTETALLDNVTPKFSRNIDEFNNNDLDAKIPNKMSALRALNDLYNVKNNVDLCNGDLKTLINSGQNVDQSAKRTTLNFENNEMTGRLILGRNVESNKEINKVYTALDSNNVENGAFTTDYKEEIIDAVPYAKSNTQEDSTSVLKNIDNSKNRSDWFDYSEIGKWVQKGQEACLKEKNNETEIKNEADGGNKSFNEFLSQVAELDEIYADTHNKLVQAATVTNVNPQMMDVDVCDNQTYTSLQMAMKNPIELFDITDDRKYEDVAVPKQDTEVSVTTPTLTTKRDVMHEEAEERLPPLPPKRIRKMPSMPLLPRPISAQALVTEAPNKNLPSLPDTLSKHARQGLFSKLFAKKNKKDKWSGSDLTRDSDPSLNTSYLLKSSVQDAAQSQIPRPSMTSVTSVKSLKLDDDETPLYGLDLTEAEHYALYTTMAPRATASEFDEMSFYYSLVEGGKILTEAKET
ncbi:embryonic polarity protein dorsal [Solenopsis invicta]|uniref:embryonic polarity protein dorsal n=1 Tax=Solenopsis invicta TaxID=13686 RepID=UPI000595D589|nr:embryonic polarity protein dorsal [Solenopsis invicta]XP_025987582.1 embryonic polarity protein dorsal [Solenopsis invicta]